MPVCLQTSGLQGRSVATFLSAVPGNCLVLEFQATSFLSSKGLESPESSLSELLYAAAEASSSTHLVQFRIQCASMLSITFFPRFNFLNFYLQHDLLHDFHLTLGLHSDYKQVILTSLSGLATTQELQFRLDRFHL